MKRLAFLTVLMTLSLFGFAQQDWFGFNRYKAANKTIIDSADYPKVVFMGNSITDYWAYYHPDFFTDNNFCCRGISGQTSSQMLVRFTADVIALHPKAVVIMAGTNDVAHNEYYVEPEQVVNNIIAMCQLAKANKITPVICSIPPCSEFIWRKEIRNAAQTIVDINKELKAFAKKNNIKYVDFHSEFADRNDGFQKKLSDDGCHPNPETYFTMEKMIMKVLKKVAK
jgi:lysophospholipase L1-like esterase